MSFESSLSIESKGGNAGRNEDTRVEVRSTVGGNRSLFRTRPVRDWMAEFVDKPRQKALFGEFWLEDELAVMFGERGMGKSALAVQIGDAIAKGEPVVPFEEVPAAQRVLYFDLELSARQFEARYDVDAGPEEKWVSLPYEFSPDFLRSEIDPCAALPEEHRRMEDFVLAEIEKEVLASRAKVVIIDNIDRFNGEIMRNRDLAYVMNRLRKLKAALGLSVLVLAHLPRRHPKTPLAANNLIATRTLCALADNVFAIGECRWDERYRYLKHLKSRSTDLVYDAEYVPSFLLAKDDGNFLSFFFTGFRREATLLDAYLNKTRLKRADQVKELAAEGREQRAIAVYLDMSLGSVNRSLKMWSPFDDRPKPPPPRPKRARPTKTGETVEHTNENGPLQKPAREQGRNGQPRSSALPDGRASAKTVETVEQTNKAKVPKTAAAKWTAEELASLRAAHPARLIGHREYDFDPTVVLDESGIVCDPTHPMFGLKRSFDSNGREIFVAREYEHDQKPKLWYTYTSKPGTLNRWEHQGVGITGKHVHEVTDRYEI